MQLMAPDGLAGGAVTVRPEISRRRRPPAGNIASHVLEHLPVAVMVLDQDLRLRHWNRQAMLLLGAPAFLAEAAPPLEELLVQADGMSSRQRHSIVAYCRDQIPGAGIDPDSCLSLPHGRDGRLLLRLRGIGRKRWLLLIEDPLPPHVLEGPEAWLDALTGVTNPRGLRRELVDATGPAGGDEPFSLIVLDLDGFASVNDTFGRAVGDAVLCLAARRLRREARSADLVARHGGDSFAVLAREAESAGSLATRMIRALGAPFQADGHRVLLSATAGLACFPIDADGPGMLLDQAEAALAAAKARVRGGWVDYARMAEAGS